MSRHYDAAFEALTWEPEAIYFDPWEQYNQDRKRLGDEVECGDLTTKEASDILNQLRVIYGIDDES